MSPLPKNVLRILLCTLFGMHLAVRTNAQDVRVAVASNFAPVMSQLAKQFEAETDYQVIVSPGSTGKHYAQILHGAPYDVFFAADDLRPVLLEERGYGLRGSRFTYAEGKLVLWSASEDCVDPFGKVLERGTFEHLAIANPKLAPYGAAAKQVLQALDHWVPLSNRIVQGENIAQTFHFVFTGNAELGFVAASQLQRPDKEPAGSTWEVPQELYDPIRQEAVQLTDRKPAREFLSFVREPEALRLIQDYGYNTP